MDYAEKMARLKSRSSSEAEAEAEPNWGQQDTLSPEQLEALKIDIGDIRYELYDLYNNFPEHNVRDALREAMDTSLLVDQAIHQMTPDQPMSKSAAYNIDTAVTRLRGIVKMIRARYYIKALEPVINKLERLKELTMRARLAYTFEVTEDVEIILDSEHYLLEAGDKISIIPSP